MLWPNIAKGDLVIYWHEDYEKAQHGRVYDITGITTAVYWIISMKGDDHCVPAEDVSLWAKPGQYSVYRNGVQVV